MVLSNDTLVGRGNNWTLVDPRPYHRKYPDTFLLPSAEELTSIHVGDGVKLWFNVPLTVSSGERMWARITEIDGDILTGTIENGPHVVPLSYGDRIRFRHHHVMDIEVQQPSSDPEATAQISKIMSMFDSLRREPTDIEIAIMGARVTRYLSERAAE